MAGNPVRKIGIHRKTGRGRRRSAARHRGLGHQRHRAGKNPTAGQTAPGCSRHRRPHRDCHRGGSNRRSFHCRDRIRQQRHGSSWDACHRRRRPGHVTGRRQSRRRSRPGCPSSRHGSHCGPRRTHRGRCPIRGIRQSLCCHRWSRRGSNCRRPSHRIDRSHPSPLGVPNRQSYGPRHRSGVRHLGVRHLGVRHLGVRARYRRRRAPARCRPQPLKPPPEHISLHPTRSKTQTDPSHTDASCCYLALIRPGNDSGRKARYTRAILPR